MSSGVGCFSVWLPGHELKSTIVVSLRLECWAPLAPAGMSTKRITARLGRQTLSTQPLQSPFLMVPYRDREVCDYCLTQETKRRIVPRKAPAEEGAIRGQSRTSYRS